MSAHINNDTAYAVYTRWCVANDKPISIDGYGQWKHQQTKIDDLLTALKKYGSHEDHCESRHCSLTGKHPCDCGFHEVIAKAKAGAA